MFNHFLNGVLRSMMLTEDEKNLVEGLSFEYSKWIKSLSKQEKYIIRKYTYNSHDDKKPNRYYERLNKAMRGKYNGSDKAKLLKHGLIISNAICRQPLKTSLICYRGVDDDLMKGIKIGTVFSFDQFVSTSVVETGALKKRFKYVIVVPEGTNGAYIENISAFKGQYEFLLDYKCKFLFKAKSGRIIYLEVVT